MIGPIYQVAQGNCLTILPKIPSKSVHAAVTSPPYWKLRDYQVDGQLGQEKTVEEYITNLMTIFDEVHRVLRDDGTFWLNIGDTFVDKQLVGVPWMVAFEMKKRGWLLRSDNIWAKPNPMTRAVPDNTLQAHEYLFLFSKSKGYFFDAEAIKEPSEGNPSGRYRRSVWTVSVARYKGAHFAVFPKKLITPCVLASTSEKGCCPECGAQMARIVEKTRKATRPAKHNKKDPTKKANRDNHRHISITKTVGWRPTCGHQFEGKEVRPVVMDMFSGAGTAGIVVTQQGRNYFGIELNKEFADLSRRDLAKVDPLCCSEGVIFPL